MQIFRMASLRHKLILIIMLTSGVALLTAGIAYVTFDVVTFRRTMQRDLAILTTIIGTNSTAALAFGDQDAAEETLASLNAEPHIVSACLYTLNRQVLASYHHRDALHEHCPPHDSGGEGAHFKNSHLEPSQLFRAVLRASHRQTPESSS